MSFPANQVPYGIPVSSILRSNGPFYHPLSYTDVQFQFPALGGQQQQPANIMGFLNNQSTSTPVNSSTSPTNSGMRKSGLPSLSPSATTASPATATDIVSPISNVSDDDQRGAMPSGRIDLRRQLCEQNVFVFHLPPEYNDDTLRKLFEPFGSIMSVKVVQRPDGSSKGYGFVCFFDPASAKRAVQDMNDFYVAGKRLKVSLKKTPEQCMSIEVQKLLTLSDSGGSFDPDHDCTLFVFHLPPHWNDEELFNRFKEFGDLMSATVARKNDKSSRGYGFVKFANPRAAAFAISQLNGADVGSNKRLKVQLKQQTQQHHKAGCTVFVFHLPSDWNETVFRQHFSHYGKIVNVTIQRDAQGKNRGFGFISFDRPQSAMNAIAGMNGFSVGQKRLKVAWKDGEERFFAAFPPMGHPHLNDLVYGQQATGDQDPATPTAAVPPAAIPPPLTSFTPTAAGNAWLPSGDMLAAAAQVNAYQMNAIQAAAMSSSPMSATAEGTTTNAYGTTLPLADYGTYAAIGTPWNTLHAMQLHTLQDHQRDTPQQQSSSGYKNKNWGSHSKR